MTEGDFVISEVAEAWNLTISSSTKESQNTVYFTVSLFHSFPFLKEKIDRVFYSLSIIEEAFFLVAISQSLSTLHSWRFLRSSKSIFSLFYFNFFNFITQTFWQESTNLFEPFFLIYLQINLWIWMWRDVFTNVYVYIRGKILLTLLSEKGKKSINRFLTFPVLSFHTFHCSMWRHKLSFGWEKHK